MIPEARPLPRLFKPREAAALLKVEVWFVYAHAQELQAIRLGRRTGERKRKPRIRIPDYGIEAFLKRGSLPQEEAASPKLRLMKSKADARLADRRLFAMAKAQLRGGDRS